MVNHSLELRRRPISTGSSSGEAKVVDLTEDNSEDEVIDLTVPSRTSAPQMSPKKDDDVIVIPSSPATLTSIPDSPSSPSKQLISCPVCMESVKTFTASGRLLVTTKCGHLFCDKCIQKTIGLLHKCPTCSTKLTQRQFHRIYI